MGCGWSGRIWIFAGGQAVSELSGGEACERLDGLRTAYGYNFWEVAFKIGVINSPVFWEYYSKDSLRIGQKEDLGFSFFMRWEAPSMIS